MARRTLGTMFVTLMVAIMIGIREGTGLAPPPPMLSTEEIEWLSPEPEHDLGSKVFFDDFLPSEKPDGPDPHVGSSQGLFGRAMALLRKMTGRFG